MKQKIEVETAADKMMLDDANEVIMSPVIYTEITKHHGFFFNIFLT